MIAGTGNLVFGCGSVCSLGKMYWQMIFKFVFLGCTACPKSNH